MPCNAITFPSYEQCKCKCNGGNVLAASEFVDTVDSTSLQEGGDSITYLVTSQRSHVRMHAQVPKHQLCAEIPGIKTCFFGRSKHG